MTFFTAIGALVTSAAGAISTFVGGLTWAGIGTALLKGAVGVGLNYLASAVAGKNKASTASFAVNGQLQSGGTVPRSIIFGMTATAGSLVYANTWGNAGKTPNAYVTQVIALADAPIKSLLVAVVNGVACEIDFDHPHAEYGWPVVDYRKGNTDYLWLKFYDGTQTEADSFLVNRVSSTARPYENTRVGHGVAYVIATSRVNQELFSGFPSFKFVLDGMRLYDPSKDSSVGGNGPQRWSDASTWGGDGDRLPVVQLYALMRGIRWNGQWLYGLQTVTERRLPASHWIAQIGKCRTLIEGADGMEATYRSGAEVQVSAALQDAAQAMLTACNGRLAEIGGTYKPFIGVSDEPVMTFSDADILSTEEQSFAPFFGLSDTVNGISASYPSPDDAWNMTEAPPLYNGDYEVEDGNRRLLSDVSLDFVPYAGQVQRLMQSALKEARRARRHTISMPPKFGALEPGDIVATSSNRNGYVEKRFRVDGVLDQPNLDVVLDITEVDPTDYSWNQSKDYKPPVTGSVSSGVPVAQSTTGWSVVAGSVTDSDSQDRRPAIVVSCTADLDDVARVWVKVRIKATGVVVYDSDAHPYAGAATWTLSGTWCLALTEYEVQGKLVPVSSRETVASDWLSVTTLNLSESTDVLDGSIVSSKIADAAVTASKIMDEAVTNLKLADAAVSTSKLQVEAVTQEILAAKSVIADKLADAAVTGAKLAAEAVDATKLAAEIEPVKVVTQLPTSRVSAYVTFNGEAYRWNGAAYVKTVSTAELTGQLIGSQIADLAIVASKIADGIITGSKVAADTITGNNLAVGSITAKSLAVTDYTNLIPNGNFNTDDLGSLYDLNTAAGKGAIYFAGGINVNGNRGLVLQKVTTPYNTYDLSILLKTANAIPVEGGATYGWGVQYYTNSGTTSVGGFYFRLRWLDANKTELSNQDPVNNAIITGTRSKYSGQVVAPAAARFVTVQIYSNANNANTTNLLVDYMYLQKANAAQLIVDGSILANMLSAGSVTTDKLAANSVIAGKIAAGAVNADQLVAGAVVASKIAGGAITADKLAVGVSANQLTNSDASAGTTGWGVYYANGGVYSLTKRTDGYAPANGSSFELTGNVNNAQYADMGPLNPLTGGPKSFAVSAGAYYEFSGRYYAQSCRAVTFYIQWINAAGTTIGYSGQQYDATNLGGNPNYDFTRYQQGYVKGQAPANAVAARVFFRCEGFNLATGSGNTYAWVTQMFFGVATVNQTSATVWSDGGTTLIQNGNIVTGTITADRLVAGTLTATQIAAGAIVGANIAAGTITGSNISATTITGTNIAASTIGADKLAANSVTAKQLVLTDFSNLVPDNQMQDPGNSWPGAGWASWTDPYLGGMASLSQMKFTYVAGATGYGGELLGKRFPVQAGAQYRVTGSAYGNSVVSPLLRIKWLDRSGALISYIDFLSGDQSAGIKTATVNLTAPSNAAYAQMAAYVWRTTTTNDVYVGGFVVNKRNAAELIVDGAITANQLSVNSLSAITANLGTVTAGEIRSTNGKMIISLNAGTILITD
ncbi:phage tail protein [Agrobacterium vitis]|uniref:phage tail protein n=2 Tax=Rhizobium/Agrobacterium group TaxID=227290 RepID=UPI001573476C|nr:phage tail protein [Agrobacterium vitis]NSX96468.1 hypothetical protein [Agrobacterium vitis]NSZ27607.1 hypothetical protein [Agrobacterium vitis]UJL77567.1 hypothetical protein AVCG678_08680 [Agrobacterium vitis]UJL82777.1 hypothetical protein AVCG78_08680 [Agrobacterium vitis]